MKADVLLSFQPTPYTNYFARYPISKISNLRTYPCYLRIPKRISHAVRNPLVLAYTTLLENGSI